MKIVEIDEKYELGTGELKIKVALGDGQPGSYNVLLDNDVLPNSDLITVGNSNLLEGKSLLIVATIRDVLKETNWTSVKIEMSDDVNTKPLGPYSRKVDQDYGKIIYSIEIDLI